MDRASWIRMSGGGEVGSETCRSQVVAVDKSATGSVVVRTVPMVDVRESGLRALPAATATRTVMAAMELTTGSSPSGTHRNTKRPS